MDFPPSLDLSGDSHLGVLIAFSLKGKDWLSRWYLKSRERFPCLRKDLINSICFKTVTELGLCSLGPIRTPLGSWASWMMYVPRCTRWVRERIRHCSRNFRCRLGTMSTSTAGTKASLFTITLGRYGQGAGLQQERGSYPFQCLSVSVSLWVCNLFSHEATESNVHRVLCASLCFIHPSFIHSTTWDPWNIWRDKQKIVCIHHCVFFSMNHP